MAGEHDLQSRLDRLEGLRPHLRGLSRADLDLLISITREGIRRPSVPAKAGIAAILDMILSVDPRLAAGPLAAAARAAERALEAVPKAR
jgi:hypothetical protein